MEGAAPIVCPALWTAASLGQPEEVLRLLMGGADIQEKGGPIESTPLHEAARLGNEGVVLVLLEYGANVYAKQTDGATPLHIALDYATGQTFLQRTTMKRLRYTCAQVRCSPVPT
jgi:ankyrin repeat protein